MAYARDNRNTTHGSPMRTHRKTNYDDDHSPSRNRHTLQPGRTDSDDATDSTTDLVTDFKRVVQSKTRNGAQMTQDDVEAEVAKIRSGIDPDQCDYDRWKRNLPSNLRTCPKSVLTASMAYGNNPRDVQSIIESKMNGTNSDGDATDTSLDKIISPLKRLKKELDRNKSPNIFKSIREFDEKNIDSADRLFFIEAHHYARTLKDYTYTDAQNAVKAIRQTDCEDDSSTVLLPIIKTYDNTDDIRDYLEKTSKKNKGRAGSRSRKSSCSDDDDDQTPPPPPLANSTTPKRNTSDNDTSTFHIKPFDNSYPSQSTASGSSRRFAHLQNEDPPPSFSSNRPPRK